MAIFQEFELDHLIHVQKYWCSVVKEWANEEAEAEMELINAVAKATRTLRMAYELQPKLRYKILYSW
jgi:valyl-tRNA synthetase